MLHKQSWVLSPWDNFIFLLEYFVSHDVFYVQNCQLCIITSCGSRILQRGVLIPKTTNFKCALWAFNQQLAPRKLDNCGIFIVLLLTSSKRHFWINEPKPTLTPAQSPLFIPVSWSLFELPNVRFHCLQFNINISSTDPNRWTKTWNQWITVSW